MNEESRAAFLFSQSVCVLTRTLGMMSENMQREHLGQSMAYQQDAFEKVLQEGGIEWNDALTTLRG
jgi:hypothetical protein